MDDFVVLALLAGIGVALVTGALGSFVVWRRMAYFGDSLAHSSLMGIALGLLCGFRLNIGVLIVSALFAGLLTWLQRKRFLAIDTLLGILAHSALAIGIVLISVLPPSGINTEHFLIGDILSVTEQDLIIIGVGGAAVLALLINNWASLTLMTIHEDLAQAEGVNTLRMHILIMIMMTVVVAISVQLVGALLVTSMLIIPSATARQLARSPEAMAITGAILGVIAVILGILSSMHLDTPTGPSIVVATTVLFTLVLPISLIVNKQSR